MLGVELVKDRWGWGGCGGGGAWQCGEDVVLVLAMVMRQLGNGVATVEQVKRCWGWEADADCLYWQCGSDMVAMMWHTEAVGLSLRV
jgi:hypothetical protein